MMREIQQKKNVVRHFCFFQNGGIFKMAAVPLEMAIKSTPIPKKHEIYPVLIGNAPNVYILSLSRGPTYFIDGC